MAVRALLFFLTLFAAGCSQRIDPYASMNEEELLQDRVRLFEDLGDTLSKVVDERTEKENYGHVQEIASRLKKNKLRNDKLHRDKTAPKPKIDSNWRRMEESLKKALDRVVVEYRRLRPVMTAQPIAQEVQFTLNQQGINPLPAPP